MNAQNATSAECSPTCDSQDTTILTTSEGESFGQLEERVVLIINVYCLDEEKSWKFETNDIGLNQTSVESIDANTPQYAQSTKYVSQRHDQVHTIPPTIDTKQNNVISKKQKQHKPISEDFAKEEEDADAFRIIHQEQQSVLTTREKRKTNICPECRREFWYPSHLVRHRRVHTG